MNKEEKMIVEEAIAKAIYLYNKLIRESTNEEDRNLTILGIAELIMEYEK